MSSKDIPLGPVLSWKFPGADFTVYMVTGSDEPILNWRDTTIPKPTVEDILEYWEDWREWNEKKRETIEKKRESVKKARDALEKMDPNNIVLNEFCKAVQTILTNGEK